MKKITAIVFALVLAFCLLPTSAFAVGALPQPDSYDYSYGSLPQPDGYGDSGWGTASDTVKENFTLSSSIAAPVITSEPSDISGSIGSVAAALQVGASSSGGELHYQWYAAYTSSTGSLTAIPGAHSATYTPAQTAGTTYYVVGVYAVSGSYRSSETLSRPAAVTYSGIEIISAPSRTSYTQGESVSLKGLVVRVYDASGSYWDSYDGSGLSLYPSKLDVAGTTAVDVSYGQSFATFYVTVKAAASASGTSSDADGDSTEAEEDGEHVHEWGEWEVTKEATCIATGLQTRTCATCGEEQTEVIPKTDHSWDEGVITKQPTATTNGAKLYTCSICKANKSEIIPAGTDTSASSTQTVSGTTSSADTTVTNATPAVVTPTSGVVSGNEVASGSTAANDTGTVNQSTDSSSWWLIPVSALVLVGCGTGAYYLMKKKGGEE